MITNKINGKKYIGQTKLSMEKRFNKHKQDALVTERSYALHLSIRKYGIENFEIKTLCRCVDMMESNHREKYYIKLFLTLAPKGYNLRPGGSNSNLSEETKKKISISKMGEKNPNFGKHFSKEHKKNLSIAHAGRGLGSKLSEETKKKISIGNKGKPISQEHREKIAKTLTGVPQTDKRKENIRIAFWKSPSAQSRIHRLIQEGIKTAKSVLCHQNKTVYRSLHEAAKELSLQRQHIKGVCDGKSKFTKGYSFEYIQKDPR